MSPEASVADFLDYQLPQELIAQHPAGERDKSRLLVVRRQAGTIEHQSFIDLPELLRPGDLLVLNDTRVIPARLLGRRERTGGKWEGLFLREAEAGTWLLLCQTRGTLLKGEFVILEPGGLHLLLIEKLSEGQWLVRPEIDSPAAELLQRYGHVPIPPYIRKGRADSVDADRYQTVFSRSPGAVAAPTAGLHFTPRLLERLAARGIDHAFVTLHVGQGTFQPVTVNDHTLHKMHAETGSLPEETVQAIAACRARGGRVVAVGTTAVRVLETVAASGKLRPWTGETSLYIYPPFKFRQVDALVTNFHLPRTSLLLLVAAFAGVELIRRAYLTAIDERYRFYSYGDAMLIG